MTDNGNIFITRDVLQRPISIHSTKGVIVVTSANDSCDHILGAGDSLHIRPKGLLAIRGLSPEAGAIVFGGRTGRQGRELGIPHRLITDVPGVQIVLRGCRLSPRNISR